jgi:hypothetical protein
LDRKGADQFKKRSIIEKEEEEEDEAKKVRSSQGIMEPG